jgi:hypothetical protein
VAGGRLRLARLPRNGGGETFFPWATAHLARARNSHRRHPPLRSGPRADASSIASGFPIAIEAAVVAGSKQLRRSDMANIGSFKKSNSEFQGEIVTLRPDKERPHRPRDQQRQRQRPQPSGLCLPR